MLRLTFIHVLMIALLGLSACASGPRNTTPSSSVSIKPGRTVSVQQGETLYSFARRNKVSMRELIDLNRLQAPYQLTSGTTLRLPASDSDLPSVELGPIAAENEKEYKKKHSGKPRTTYTQVAPDPITPQRADELADDTPYAPRLNGQQSALQDAANQQFDAPPSQQYAARTPTSALNLQPMVFDRKNNHLANMPRPSTPVNVAVPEKTLPQKTADEKPVTPKVSASKYVPRDKHGKVKQDPNEEGSEPLPQPKAAVVPPQLKAPEAKKVEVPQDDSGMHSRIEKGVEPKNFIWPVNGTIISTFGPKSNGLNNDGINIAVPRGTPVVAADGGTVAYAGSDIPGYGNVVLVRHPTGLMTTYAHLDRMFVQQDIVVAKGDLLGSVGTTGGVDTPQLHFEIRRNKEALDPSKYLYK
ncbi:MAG: peptidoglycan DD-metalloendopeptidase family protein [Alphaproteobacteria bacterium]|nr:peptidoglycan DD-metalloendopeptidase family protein [Alphaproteobacteria bacterium]